jgi:hypothetical protein
MKRLQLIGVIACAWFVSCESTETASRRNQERKRLAALQQQRQQAQPDEGQQNLWSAQQNTMNRDGNPMRGY